MGHTIIIAEIGLNHNGNMDLAKKLIDLAVIAGCDAVKFQKRTIDKVYSKEFLIGERKSPWGNTQRDQKEGLEFGINEYIEIEKYCKSKNIDWFASAWDLESQIFLEQFNCRYNKVASAMLVNYELLNLIAKEGKYTFISTGMSNYSEIEKALEIFDKASCPYELMHCNSTYPMSMTDANLKLIEVLKEKYQCKVGYSGHENGILVSINAVAAGATSIERHITLDKTMYGSDQKASMEPYELCELVKYIRDTEVIMGNGIKELSEAEKEVKKIKGKSMIEFVIFDIDGVITNGTIIVDSDGKEQKQINLKDIDAIFELKKRGFKIGAITGEDSEIVKYFQYRFPWDVFYSGNKSKRKTLELLCEEKGLEAFQICYIGDGKYDIDALEYAGLGVCPSDAIEKAKIAADVVLQQAGGQGCIWELVSFLEKYNDSNDSQNYVYQRLVEHMLIFKSMASDIKLKSEIIRVGDHLINIFQQNGSLFICGNGGSAADAQHIEAEFVSRFYKERPGLNAEALSVNTSCITAIGNDYCFEDIFVRQLQAKAKQGDMILGITTSGNSKNVVEAMRYGKKNGLTTVILTGEQAKLEWENNSDYTINIPSSITPRIQEAHIFCGHVLAEYVEHKMFN